MRISKKTTRRPGPRPRPSLNIISAVLFSDRLCAGRAQQLTWHMNKHASGQEVSNFGLFIYLSVSIAVTHYCGGGPLSLVTVVIFFLISLGRPASHQKKPKSDYVFDHVDIDSEDE
jgi:hypothetical protein